MRGEDALEYLQHDLKSETPPRAWGRLYEMVDYVGSHRNTPTCVGKTKKSTGGARRKKKHPHVRGEDHLHRCKTAYIQETPPRAWGRPADTNNTPLFLRNTPTCVGKTEVMNAVVSKKQKHPHVRGEDQLTAIFI